MATIRAYTTIEQSRKLAETLPLESADMYYWHGSHRLLRVNDGKCEDIDIPAWSLAALLGVLPILDNRSPVISKTFDGKYRVVYHSTAYEKAILTSDYDNPVDACYEMIIKLR